ncbi:hypothetical protein AB0K52_10975 [Glycomyces sp. NPDC049804]|uniref:hypothetical protein n=1 Tax=Glycomyces sp. NPDC049804 TaxID=3154363 RepID=UPI003413228A
MPWWAKALISILAAVTALLLAFAAIELVWIGKQIDWFFSVGESDDPTGPPPEGAGDFNEHVCLEFDLAAFDEFTGGTAEFASATAFPDEDPRALHCHFRTAAGEKLSIAVFAGSEEDYAADAVLENREGFEGAAWAVEDLATGSLVGYSRVFPGESWETYGVELGYERIMISVTLEYEPGAGARETAVEVADTAASAALNRFLDYA